MFSAPEINQYYQSDTFNLEPIIKQNYCFAQVNSQYLLFSSHFFYLHNVITGPKLSCKKLKLLNSPSLGKIRNNRIQQFLRRSNIAKVEGLMTEYSEYSVIQFRMPKIQIIDSSSLNMISQIQMNKSNKLSANLSFSNSEQKLLGFIKVQSQDLLKLNDQFNLRIYSNPNTLIFNAEIQHAFLLNPRNKLFLTSDIIRSADEQNQSNIQFGINSTTKVQALSWEQSIAINQFTSEKTKYGISGETKLSSKFLKSKSRYIIYYDKNNLEALLLTEFEGLLKQSQFSHKFLASFYRQSNTLNQLLAAGQSNTSDVLDPVSILSNNWIAAQYQFYIPIQSSFSIHSGPQFVRLNIKDLTQNVLNHQITFQFSNKSSDIRINFAQAYGFNSFTNYPGRLNINWDINF